MATKSRINNHYLLSSLNQCGKHNYLLAIVFLDHVFNSQLVCVFIFLLLFNVANVRLYVFVKYIIICTIVSY